MTFPFDGLYVLEDPETNQTLQVDGQSSRAGYVSDIEEFREEYKKQCSKMGVDYVAVDTSMQFDKALMEYLLSRRGR